MKDNFRDEGYTSSGTTHDKIGIKAVHDELLCRAMQLKVFFAKQNEAIAKLLVNKDKAMCQIAAKKADAILDIFVDKFLPLKARVNRVRQHMDNNAKFELSQEMAEVCSQISALHRMMEVIEQYLDMGE
jgi:hypothetical protein